MNKVYLKLLTSLLIISSLFFTQSAKAQQWDSVGGGTNGIVYALAPYNSNLFAGGSFSLADISSANNIAQWNGANWTPAGPGILFAGTWALRRLMGTFMELGFLGRPVEVLQGILHNGMAPLGQHWARGLTW